VRQIRDYVLAKCKDVRVKQDLKEIFENGKLGIIVNERVLNMPPTITPQLHGNLFEEIQTAITNDKCTFFKHYLILSRVYFDADDTNLQHKHFMQLMEGNEKKKQRKIMYPQERADCEQSYFKSKSKNLVHFIKPEEELYYVRSKLAFSFEIANEYTYDSKTVGLDNMMTNEALVMVIEREKIPKVLKTMQETFGAPNAEEQAGGDDENLV